ncbi:MAG TPA: hypothetical protein VFS43_31645 [Polyangiaceae bacterium]|nr:hypothetical protein [Polyangiaceae bacterium]
MARSRLAAALTLALGAPMICDCSETKTRVQLRVTTDLPCPRVNGVSITGGRRGQIEDRRPAFYSDSCVDSGGLGTFLLVPLDEYLNELELKVVVAVLDEAGAGPAGPDACTPATGYAGCIVARRAFSALPDETIYVEVPLLANCLDVASGCGPERTCVAGLCFSALVEDPNVCLQSGVCDNNVLPDGALGAGG